MSHRIRLFVSAAFLIVVTFVSSLSVLATQEAEVPPQLQPPVDEQLLVQLHAKGDQIYACKSESPQFNWTLKAADAQLFDKQEQLFGKHCAGPTSQATDGTRVTGNAAVSIASPDAGCIPCLPV